MGPTRALSVAALVLVVGLGVFRGGALLPADRPALVVSLLACGVLLAAAVVAWSGTPHPRARWLLAGGAPFGSRAAFLGLLGLALLAFVSAAWSPNPVRTLWQGALLSGGVVTFWAGRQLAGVRESSGLPLLTITMAVLGTAVSWISLVAYGAGRYGWVGVLEDVRHAQGPLGYANALAGLLVLTALPTAFGVWASRRSPLTVTGFIVALALQTWCLVLTRSRGAALALGVALGVLVVLRAARALSGGRRGSWFGRWIVPSALVLAAVIVAVSTATLGAGYVRNLADSPTTGTDQMRARTWEAGLRAAAERPVLGWGADMWYEAYEPYRTAPATRFAHNLLVQQAVELGAAGVTLVVVIGLGVIVASAQGARRRGPRAAMTLDNQAVWLGGAAVAFLAQNLVDFTWFVPALFYLFCACLGGVAAAGDTEAPVGHRNAAAETESKEVSQ